jgi:hypothetical protein
MFSGVSAARRASKARIAAASRFKAALDFLAKRLLSTRHEALGFIEAMALESVERNMMRMLLVS